MKFLKTLDAVNLRAESGTGSQALGTFYPNTILYQLGDNIRFNDEHWHKVLGVIASGETLVGWVASHYHDLSLSEEVESLGWPNPYRCQTNLTQLFGENPSLYAQFNYKGHNGVDFNGGQGADIFSISPGSVETGFDKSGYGNYIRVEGANYVTVYAHLSYVAVQNGQTVSPGDFLGKQGNSGNSFGEHLHLDIRDKRIVGDNGFGGRFDPLLAICLDNITFPDYCTQLNEVKK